MPGDDAETVLQKMVCQCEKEDKKKKPEPDCKKLGDRKHACVDKKI